MSRRLYRGIAEPYRPEEVRARQRETLSGTDFTDCPFRALSHALGRKGEVLVIDVPDDAGLSVTEELWLTGPEKRFMVWGTFDRWLTAILPAKELRREVRRKGIGGLSSPDKGEILKQAIERRLAERTEVREGGPLATAHGPVGPGREERCATCGGELVFGATILVTGRGTFCSSCYNAELSAQSGVRFDNVPLEPVTLQDPKGVPHTFLIHSRLALGLGHVMEAIEDRSDGLGYAFKVVGPEECDALALFRELYARMRSGLETSSLTETPLGLGLADGQQLLGRIEMDCDRNEPIVVVDGRPCSWDEIGRLLLTYEGWNVHLEIRSALEVTSLALGAGKPSGQRH